MYYTVSATKYNVNMNVNYLSLNFVGSNITFAILLSVCYIIIKHLHISIHFIKNFMFLTHKR